MENFEKITANLLLDRIKYLLKEIEIKKQLEISDNRQVAKVAEVYYIAAKLFNIEVGLSSINESAINYWQIEQELKLIAK